MNYLWSVEKSACYIMNTENEEKMRLKFRGFLPQEWGEVRSERLKYNDCLGARVISES